MTNPIKDRDILVLGIESSCDETSAAVVQNTRLLSNVIANQKVHHTYGGVVPELASRAHLQNIIPVIHAALDEAGVKKNKIDAIAYTRGPGLAGALLVGSSVAKSLSIAWEKPLIEVNHMRAHVLAHFIEDKLQTKHPSFPFICLTVSGGHTQLVLVRNTSTFELLGETIDDAAGEAFDKCAKILGLDYPGGPLIDKLAKEGNATRFSFGKPKIQGLNYSFSGLKTSVLYFVRDEVKKDEAFISKHLNDLCASIQHSIIQILIDKLVEATKKTGIKEVALAGGVSANAGLRNELTNLGKKHNWKVFVPDFQYCTDNAAMIAVAGYFQYIHDDFSAIDKEPLARWAL
ncbi:MAG: tRNA (adenosine(37)-N6)-threonylcarbamoyltransferase complex transferase subunit TsaD [Flavobacteriales bacterium]